MLIYGEVYNAYTEAPLIDFWFHLTVASCFAFLIYGVKHSIPPVSTWNQNDEIFILLYILYYCIILISI